VLINLSFSGYLWIVFAVCCNSFNNFTAAWRYCCLDKELPISKTTAYVVTEGVTAASSSSAKWTAC
jgi:hypothetical protein